MPACMTLRELRTLDAMTTYSQVASDLFSFPPYQHRKGPKCSCPPAPHGRPLIHRWPCALATAAAGTGSAFAHSLARDEAELAAAEERAKPKPPVAAARSPRSPRKPTSPQKPVSPRKVGVPPPALRITEPLSSCA